MPRPQPNRAQDYARQVDREFLAGNGVAYSFMRGDLESHGVAPRMEEAIHHDLPPGEFARRVRDQFGLRAAGSPDAIPFNRRVATLAAFAAENPEWTVGRNGSIYREGQNGIERLSPSRDISGKGYGYAASVSTRATLDTVDGEAVVEGEGFIPVAGGTDIGIAVERLEETYQARLMM